MIVVTLSAAFIFWFCSSFYFSFEFFPGTMNKVAVWIGKEG